MRIEIDTKHDSKEELFHLSRLLHSLSNHSQNLGSSLDSNPLDSNPFGTSPFANNPLSNTDQQSEKVPKALRKMYSKKESQQNGGMFSIFESDNKPEQSSVQSSIPEQSQVTSQEQSSGIFNIFGDDKTQQPSQSTVQQTPTQQSANPMSMFDNNIISNSSQTLNQVLGSTNHFNSSQDDFSTQSLLDNTDEIPLVNSEEKSINSEDKPKIVPY